MTPNFALSALYALDNLEVMRGMDSETVDLIYLDPPFNSKRMYQAMAGTPAVGQSFKDTWSWNDVKQEWLDQLEDDHPALRRVVQVGKDHSDGMGGYIAFMAVRAIEMHRILKPTGSLYLHCDPHANSYLRLLLDGVFGSGNHRNEIAWKRYRGRRAPKFPTAYPRVVDYLLLYAKGDHNTFHLPFKPLDPEYVRRTYRHDDGDGKGKYRYGGRIRDRKYYLSNSRGTPATTWWDDIPEINGTSAEDTGWATQKPLALLERVINASSNPDDIVFDPFCGCGTAMVAAQTLGRRWIGCDDDKNAVGILKQRLSNLTGTVTPGQPQMQQQASVLYQPPERTPGQVKDGVLRDPTGIVIPKSKSDRMPTAEIRSLLVQWQLEQERTRDSRITCLGCAERLPERYFHVDHNTPRADGGTNRITNRLLLCGPCNIAKGSSLTLSGLWKSYGLSANERKSRRALVTQIRAKAEAKVTEIDKA